MRTNTDCVCPQPMPLAVVKGETSGMFSSNQNIIFLVMTLFGSSCGEDVTLKRSYQVPPVAVVNDPQTLQYYAAAPLYTAIPTVLIPNQIGYSATPITGVVLPPTNELKPVQDFQETSTPGHGTAKSNRIQPQYYKPKHRTYVQAVKRPTSYINSLYGHPVRMKPLSSVSVPGQKSTSLSIQPSVDLSGQFNQEAASTIYPSTAGPPVGSTYGPAKAVEFQHKTRPSSQAVYHRMKGSSHRHPYYPPKKTRVYTHYHKDHMHSHYFPAKPQPVYKPHTVKYSGPAYLPPVSSTSSTIIETRPVQEHAPIFYPAANQLKFPEAEVQKSNNSPGDVTQAIIKNQGVINNYDASLPLKVPSKKPYKFEVNKILKNSDLHFVQEPQDNTQNTQVLQYQQKVPYQAYQTYQNPVLYNQPIYTQNVIPSNPLDIYSLPGANAYQTNHILPDQDLGTSETVKFPVAIIRGAHSIAGQGMYGITMKRQDELPGERKKAFTPSRRTSDWIPMSGSGVPLLQDTVEPEKVVQTPIETFNNEYYTAKREVKVRQPVGDIISGKIPEEFSKDLPSGSSFPERDRRKGSVIDVYPSSSSSVSEIGDTSDHVVSSVIKFS